MKIVILGSGSFAGQALFAEFLNRGFSVYGINRSSPQDSKMWPWIDSIDLGGNWLTYNIQSSVDQIIYDIRSINPDIIIDFMGQGMVAQSWDTPELWYSTNVAQKSKLLNSFLELSNLKKYIRASTPEVYGSSEAYIDENSPFNPSTPYAVSHASIDLHLRCMGRQYNFPYLIGRFANFYGVGQQLYRVIPRMFLSCYTGRKFILDGTGSSTRSFIYSDDIVSAFDRMILTDKIQEEYNFSSKEEISIFNLVTLICKLSNVEKDKILVHGPERRGKDKHYRLNISKANSDLGWHPLISLDKGLIAVNGWIKASLPALSKRSWDFELKL